MLRFNMCCATNGALNNFSGQLPKRISGGALLIARNPAALTLSSLCTCRQSCSKRCRRPSAAGTRAS